jgi:hypothetical protein
MSAIARTPGSSCYPTRNFAQLVRLVSQEAGLYLDRSRGADPGRKVSEGSLDFEGLPCGLSPCPSDFYCSLTRTSTERLYEEFPAYGPVLLRLAFPNLRTVIVTAAVYRGFSLRLRLAADHAL